MKYVKRIMLCKNNETQLDVFIYAYKTCCAKEGKKKKKHVTLSGGNFWNWKMSVGVNKVKAHIQTVYYVLLYINTAL